MSKTGARPCEETLEPVLLGRGRELGVSAGAFFRQLVDDIGLRSLVERKIGEHHFPNMPMELDVIGKSQY